MLRLIRADFYRLFHSKGFYLLLLGIVSMASMVVLFKYFPTIGPNGETYDLMLVIKDSVWNSTITFQAAVASYAFFNYLFIGFFIMTSGYEFSQRSYKNTLTSGISRTMFIVSKLLVQLLLVLLSTVLYFASIFICSFFKYGISDIDVGELVKNMLIATLCLVLCIGVIFSFANILLIITTSNVIVTIFIAAFPLIIQMINWDTGWSWMRYINLFDITQYMAFYGLTGEKLIPYIAMNIAVISCSIIISSFVIKKKEF